MNIETVDIDGITYIEVDKIEVQENTFVYLVNINNNEDFCIRKLVSRDGKIYYDGLKDDKEFDLALMYFAKKHENVLNEEV